MSNRLRIVSPVFLSKGNICLGVKTCTAVSFYCITEPYLQTSMVCNSQDIIHKSGDQLGGCWDWQGWLMCLHSAGWFGQSGRDDSVWLLRPLTQQASPGMFPWSWQRHQESKPRITSPFQSSPSSHYLVIGNGLNWDKWLSSQSVWDGFRVMWQSLENLGYFYNLSQTEISPFQILD